MSKKFIFSALIFSIIFCLCGCIETNKQYFDTTLKFDKAIVSLPDGTVISGNVDSWTDFEDGDQIQVKIDGVTYLVHASNVALISE